VSSFCDFRLRLPDQIKLWLSNIALFVFGRLFLAVFTYFFWLLVIFAVQFVAIFEVPSAFPEWLVVFEFALKEKPVRVNPTAPLDFSLFPVTMHFHASFFENVCALALFVAKTPPAGVNVTVGVSENTLSMTTVILPIAMILTSSLVSHLTDAMLGVFMPISFIFVAITLITVDTSTLANSIQKVTFVLVTIDIKGSSLSGTTARSVFVFTILCDELILTISVLSHDLEIE
jgi:hypothetical protein